MIVLTGKSATLRSTRAFNAAGGFPVRGSHSSSSALIFQPARSIEGFFFCYGRAQPVCVVEITGRAQAGSPYCGVRGGRAEHPAKLAGAPRKADDRAIPKDTGSEGSSLYNRGDGFSRSNRGPGS
jgi:hypothetical protein